MTPNPDPFAAPQLVRLFDRMAYGGDYNPDQWPEEIWQEDVRLMQEAGVNLVSLGIFSWARLEPRPGEYDFDWLDRIIDLLHAHGVRVDLATATASPPPWLAKLHPESLPVTADGTTLWPGSRQQYCPSSPAYREAAERLVRRLAERYAEHPALVLWHINNEYACHVPACYCETSAAHFRRWLEDRYTTIEALNDAWGTAFWSQRYGAWDEIQPPRTMPTFVNPTQQLDWQRFSSDALLECFDLERAILREVTPGIPVTTNFMANFKPLDYWQWTAHEDLVSLDQYQDPSAADASADAALNCDLMRSLGQGAPWLLMEQATSQVNWRPRNLVKQPGQMRLWSHQAIARGSNGVMFFQWRASRAGAEKFHSGMVPHAGTDSRTWREVVELGQELGRMGDVLPSRVAADVAILYDWESWWALEGDAMPSAAVRYGERVRAFYDPLYERNVTVDFVAPGADLGAYKLVLVPSQYLVRDSAVAALERFVRGGGTLVMAFFSGIVDEHDHVRLGGYPAPFRELLGLRVEEFAPFAAGQQTQVVAEQGQSFSCDTWADHIALEGAAALASYEGLFYPGGPAITRNSAGQGTAFYVGTNLEPAGMDWLLDQALGAAGVAPVLNAPAGVEAIRRQAGDQTLLYLLNHGAAAVDVQLPGAGTDLLGGQAVSGSLQIGPRGVAIVRLG